uniref:MADF domain-containing protein n=1 Tax=Sinocyclocheilus grahami TaxID=75366 RepID=A0A672RD65_SINGR
MIVHGNMGEKFILAVSENPILYDTSLESYRDFNRKNEAWKRVSEIVGLSVDECRKKWRDLRNVYVRERREEKKIKSGAAATQKRPWRYYHIISFLLPFVSSRPTSGNMEEERGEGRRNEEDTSVSSFERKIVEAIETSNCPAPAGSEDPDMQFLQSLMPALKRLEPKCRELTKLKIHQLIFEAEFNCEF